VKRSHWWRVALDGSGKVTSCRVVEQHRAANGSVLYVRASSESEARSTALRHYQRQVRREIRAAWHREGKCTRCGGKRDRAGLLSCSGCEERTAKAYDRKVARANGDAVPSPHRGYGSLENRLAVLLEVATAWQRARNSGVFTEWLRDQVEKLCERIAGKRAA
jgi:hypothetical protein